MNLKKKNRRYSLFEKRGNTWVRMTEKSYFLTTARYVWMDALVEPYLNPSVCKGIRKIKAVS